MAVGVADGFGAGRFLAGVFLFVCSEFDGVFGGGADDEVAEEKYEGAGAVWAVFDRGVHGGVFVSRVDIGAGLISRTVPVTGTVLEIRTRLSQNLHFSPFKTEVTALFLTH